MPKKDFSADMEQMNAYVKSAAEKAKSRSPFLKGTYLNAGRKLAAMERFGFDTAKAKDYRKALNGVYDTNPDFSAGLGLERYPDE